MGGISNDPFTLARYVGFYKAIQSAGAAGSFGMDAVATPFLNEHVSISFLLPYLQLIRFIVLQLASWIMLLVSFPLAAWVISTIKDTTYTEEKNVYVDELKNGELDSNERVDEKDPGSVSA